MKNKEKEIIEIEIPSKGIRVQHATCPNGHSLMDPDHKINRYPSITVKAKYKDLEGMIHLDPVYGSFKTVSEIKVPEGEEVEFFCPQCGVTLTFDDIKCEECGASMFGVYLPRGGRVEACLRNGCQFHNLKMVDGKELLEKLDEYHTLDSFL